MAGDKSQWLLPPRPEKVEDIRFFQTEPTVETIPMAESSSPVRGEIITDVGPAPESAPRGTSPGVVRFPEEAGARVYREPTAQPVVPAGEQLARIEDKTSRIEDKLARSEAATQRVIDRFEVASTRMSEVALQSDLMAVREDVVRIGRRVNGLPGFTALILTSVVTALLTAALFVALWRYLPALFPLAR